MYKPEFKEGKKLRNFSRFILSYSQSAAVTEEYKWGSMSIEY